MPANRTHEEKGIGLAYVRQLVYRLGGTIEMKSTLGLGTVFRLTLPLSSPQTHLEAV